MTGAEYADAVGRLPLDRGKAVDFAKSALGQQLEAAFHPLITWCVELARLKDGNPANFFLTGVYSEIIYICALIPFGFYRSAYMSLRAVIDEVSAYSYYFTHPVELQTGIRKEEVYLTRADFWSYHSEHTLDFGKIADSVGLGTQCQQIYSDLSKTIHGQVPGHICTVGSFKDIRFSAEAVNAFLRIQDRACVMLRVFLLIVFRDLYRDLSLEAKREVLKGLGGDVIKRIGVRP